MNVTKIVNLYNINKFCKDIEQNFLSTHRQNYIKKTTKTLRHKNVISVVNKKWIEKPMDTVFEKYLYI